MSLAPGVVLNSQFVMPGSKEYSEFVGYIDRDASKIKAELSFEGDVFAEDAEFSMGFASYLDYAGDEKKQGSLFTKDADILDKQGQKQLKQSFELAQQNGSPMWQDVVSFDNAWLQRFNMMDADTGQVDEVKMRSVIRDAVTEMLRAEDMADTAVWTASIHYNTDNIHVHIATVEPIPTRPLKYMKEKEKVFNAETGKHEYQPTGRWSLQRKAGRKPKSIKEMKAKVANTIANRDKEFELIDQLIKGARKKKEKQDIDFANYRKTKKLFQQALQRLPKNTTKPHWQQIGYNDQTMNQARPHIDKIVDIFIERFYKDEMNELHQRLDEEVEVMKTKYGDGSKAQNYKANQLAKLKAAMGNTVLKELRAHQKEQRSKTYVKSQNTPLRHRFERASDLHRALNQLNYRLRKTYQDYQKDRNIEEFDRMLDGYER
ncbi:MobP2 family relaxase [Metasolibacillus meyeri]|uniref:MobP2 family relaxase n=1 Tax=Metasolibacillus meyeri TaxID=1071052 RepID=A0AAW9NNE7_9BACL|nr:MobP2 family relaxase [Metasolibacillus meyeri]MEC1177253.1 MobP2 family relaxase [Metasolibacillus meyeri]